MSPRKAYYAQGKRVTVNGVPCLKASWYGDLGNDAEYLAAIKPPEPKPWIIAYYAAGYRIVRDGVPCRVAAYVADWAPWMKNALLRGPETRRQRSETERQWKILSTPTRDTKGD
jgi:hypothetical protein